MNNKTARSIAIAILMIASTQLVMLDANETRELEDKEMRAYTVSVPTSGCNGDDACTGVDAGTTMADIIDLTPGVTFAPSASGTTTSFSGYLPTYGSAGNDIYMLSVPMGYGVEAAALWEDVAGSGTSVQGSIYWIGIYTCDQFDLGLYGGISTSPTYGSPCGVDDTYASTWGGTPAMSGDAASTVGTDVGGQDIFIQVYCWDCGWYSNPSITDYDLEITVIPSDGGTNDDYGSYTASTTDTLYSCNHPNAVTPCIEAPNLVTDFYMNFTGFVTGADETGSQSNPFDIYTIDIPPNHDASIHVTMDCYNNCDAYYYQYAYLWFDGDGAGPTYNSGTQYNTAAGFGPTGNYILDLPMYGFIGTYYTDKNWLVAGSNADTIDIGFRAPSPYAVASGFTYAVTIEFQPAANAPCATADDGGYGDDAPDDGPYSGDLDAPAPVSGGSFSGTICQDYDMDDYFGLTVPAGYGIFASLDWDDSTSSAYNGIDFSAGVDTGFGVSNFMTATKDDSGPQAISSNNSGLFMPGSLATDNECSLESFGSGTDTCSVGVATGDTLVLTMNTRSWGSEVIATITLPDGTQQSWGPYYFSNYMTYDLGSWTDTGTYTISVTDTYGDGCTCTLDVDRQYYPVQQDNDVVFHLAVDSLPAEAVVNYTVTYETFPVLIHQNLDIADSALGADTTSTNPGILYSANYTYTGYMHDAWDSNDYYEMFVPENYGVSIWVHSDARNDIDITSSMGNDLDGADPAGPISMVYNPTAGGSLETISLEQVVGSGMYTMTVEVWTVTDGPGSDYDDAGLGGDAADHHLDQGTSKWNLGGNSFNDGRSSDGQVSWLNATTQNATGVPIDVTLTGTINHVWDRTDAYRLAIPSGYYANITIYSDTSLASDTVSVTIFEPEVNANAYPVWDSQNEAIGDYITNFLNPLEANTDHFNEGHFVAINIWSYTMTGDIDFEYNIDVEWDVISNLPCADDDAGTCSDAPDIYTACMQGNCAGGLPMNVTANTSHTFTGWAHSALDYRDFYSFDIPYGYGIELTMTACLSQCNYDMILYSSTGTQLGSTYSQSSTGGSWTLTTNDTSPSFSGDDVVQLRVNGQSYHDADTGWYTMTYNLFTLDQDGDSWLDFEEDDCTTASTTGATYESNNSSSYPPDNDADGICDELDDDDDNDGVNDVMDDFPMDPSESGDLDGDGIGNNADDDMDGDMWSNTDETDCLTDPLDSSSYPNDMDNDTICDYLDTDLDGDGVDNVLDYYPTDGGASVNTDGDEYPDEIHPGWTQNASAYVYDTENSVYETTLMADDDDDNDGYLDSHEVSCLSDPLMSTSIPSDADMDGVCDINDDDRDGDGVSNDDDAFPDSACASIDTDGDGKPDSIATDCSTILVEDFDDDGDGFRDMSDDFPLDNTEWLDTDSDGVGNNADLNDDGDAWTDSEEFECGTDSLDVDSVPDDYDGDGTCDKMDNDDDGDGTPDVYDAFPYDATESSDNDGDGLGDFSDTDDDNDGWFDSEEPNCATDPMDANSVPADNDMDRNCDLQDQDDDNDGYLDIDDVFPMNPSEHSDLDGDGIGDNTDTDDDDDGWLDTTEAICRDAGGYGDPRSADVFPADSEVDIGPDGEYGTDDDVIVGDGICDAVDPDDDNDGAPDPADYSLVDGVCTTCLDWEDHFPNDPTEKFDANDDGMGDVGTPLTLFDDIEAQPLPFVGVALVIIAMVVGIARSTRGGDEDGDEFDMYDETEEFEEEDEEDEEEDEA